MHLSLLMASLAAASPLAIPVLPRDITPAATPPTSKSHGFQLVVNVTDLARDTTPSIHQTFINSVHVGAGQALLGVGTAIRPHPRTFYINGTALDFHFANSSVVSDGGTPLSPWGMRLVPDADSAASTVHLDAGPGARGIGLTRWSVPYTFMYPETYAVCNQSIPYYAGRHFMIVKQFHLGLQGPRAIPANCVPVRLFAQCARLDDLPAGSLASHEFAYETECYDDVAAIDWPKYRPW